MVRSLKRCCGGGFVVGGRGGLIVVGLIVAVRGCWGGSGWLWGLFWQWGLSGCSGGVHCGGGGVGVVAGFVVGGLRWGVGVAVGLVAAAGND